MYVWCVFVFTCVFSLCTQHTQTHARRKWFRKFQHNNVTTCGSSYTPQNKKNINTHILTHTQLQTQIVVTMPLDKVFLLSLCFWINENRVLLLFTTLSLSLSLHFVLVMLQNSFQIVVSFTVLCHRRCHHLYFSILV